MYLNVEIYVNDQRWHLLSLVGEEAIDQGFYWQLEVLCEQQSLCVQDLLNQAVCLHWYQDQQLTRSVHGIIDRAERYPNDNLQRGRFTLHVVSWWQGLDYTADCRLFTQQSAVDIFQAVCRYHCLDQYQLNLHTQRASQAQPMLVQYNENTRQFLQRILAASGIFYYFRHTSEQHIMHLSDHSGLLPVREHVAFTHWEAYAELTCDQLMSCQFPVTQVAVWDTSAYSPQINYASRSAEDNFEQQQVEKALGNHWPRMTQYISGTPEQLSQQRIALRQRAHYCQATTQDYTLQVAEHITYQQQRYLISKITHRLDFTQSPIYQNQLHLLPAEEGYQPCLSQTMPKVFGLLVAQVVDEEGGQTAEEETEVSDALLRVKLRFPWQRDASHYQAMNPSLLDEDLPASVSDWCPVMQISAHEQSGWRCIPRVGDWVWVSFAEGDLTRPLVIGSCVNAEQMPVFALPKQQHLSGVKSATHSMVFADQAAHELFTMQTQADMKLHTEQDFTLTVGEGMHLQVQGDYQLNVGETFSIHASQGIYLQVGSSRLEVLPDVIRISSLEIHLG
jgi:type VI secretion system secreted protein VgrG